MWLLAGCHLFSSGAIPKTCEDVGGCGDTGDTALPLPGDPSRLLAALTCSPCDADTELSLQYVADVWLVPATGAAFPQLAQPKEWEGPVAYDAREGVAFVATGGSVVVLGPESSDLQSFPGLVFGEVLDMIAADGLVYLTTGDTVYRWEPSKGRAGLQSVDAGDDRHAFTHLFLDETDGLAFWAADTGGGVDVWRIDVASMSLELERITDDKELVAGGMFVGRDGALSGCDRDGAIFQLDEAFPVPLGKPPDARAVGCGYDPGLGGHLVLDARRGALLQPDGYDQWAVYAPPPNGGEVLAGAIVP